MELTITALIIMVGYFVYSRIIKRMIKAPESKALMSIWNIFNNEVFEDESEATIKELEPFLKKYPKSSNGWTLYGQVYQGLGDTSIAEQGYKKGYDLNKKNVAAIIGLGDVERRKGNFELSRKYFKKAMKIKPKSADVYLGLLELELKNKNYAKAVEFGEKARSFGLDKDQPGTLALLAVAYYYNNQTKEGRQTIKILENMNFRNLPYYKDMIEDNMDLSEVF